MQMQIMKHQKRAFLRPQDADVPATANNENPLAHQYINLVRPNSFSGGQGQILQH